ncbi:aminotransferase class III-fold pyridoxal phosphate-dependent enzyme, partial [Chloroflexota bacterium]
ELAEMIKANEKVIKERLTDIANTYKTLDCQVRGRGMIYGLEIGAKGVAAQISEESFKRNLVIELSGAKDNVLKLLPPLVIEEDLLRRGLDIIEKSIIALVEERNHIDRGMGIIDNS